MAYQEYPKELKHPHYRPAVVSGYKRNADGSATNDPPGQPAKFPPVVVNNFDQEQDYASRGYLPAGVSDPGAYLRATIGADQPGTYHFQEYPKWVYRVEEGEKGPELESQMVQSEAEEKRLGKNWVTRPDAAWAAVTPAEDHSSATNDHLTPAAVQRVLKAKATEKPRRKYTRKPAKAKEAKATKPPAAAGQTPNAGQE